MTATAQNTQHKPRTLIVGLGATGLSVARYLMSQGVQIAIADSRQQPPGLAELEESYSDVAVFLGDFDNDVFLQADMLVVSPGVAIATPEIQAAIARGIPVLGDVELFVRAAKAPIVAITGSNGKTTVTTLLGQMAKASGVNARVGGNIGIPTLDLLDDAVELYVLELSSFQLETTQSLQAAVATVLNVSADHMDRYESFAAYADAKSVVMQQAGLGVYNADDEVVSAMSGSSDAWFFTLNEPQSDKVFGIRKIQGRDILCRGEDALFAADELLIPGKHNQANALAALAMGSALGFDLEKMTETLKQFTGLPHRCEFVANINDVRWYNDSKATNVGAAIAALRGMHKENSGLAVIALGGDCKQGDFSELTSALKDCARAVVLLGRDADQIAGFIPDSCEVRRAVDMDEVVAFAAEMAESGDHILFAPACASFDMYANYEERGHVFSATVRRFSS